MRPSEKKRIFELFAKGKTPRQVAEILEGSAGLTPETPIGIRRAEKLFEKYLALPTGEKLRLTLMPERVSNRLHRLIDDISDLRRIDAQLDAADEKMLVSLLDIKRKIKERMAKEDAPAPGTRPQPADEDVDNEIDTFYEKVFESSAPEA